MPDAPDAPAVPSDPDRSVVVVGVVAGPGAPADLARQLLPELQRELDAQEPEVWWRLELRVEEPAEPPATSAELIDATREMLLDADWDLALCLTDLPLRDGRRTVVAHASPVQGVGVLSIPALGPVHARRRAHARLLHLVDELVGNDEDTDREDRVRRLRQLAAEEDAGTGGVRFTARLLTGNLSLLAAMVWANQPWQLTVGLSRALVGSLAAGVFALVTPDLWLLADAYGTGRMVLLTVLSLVALAATLVIGAELWERAEHRRNRRQVTLLNIATTATVVIGVASFYVVLLVLALLASVLLVEAGLHGETLGHPVDLADTLKLAWLTSSLATAGGALGAGLETDESVRRAAYTRRPRPGSGSGSAEAAGPDASGEPAG